MGLLVGFKEYLKDRHNAKIKEILKLLEGDVNRVSRKGDFYKTDNDFYTNAGILQTHRRSIDAAFRKQRVFLTKHCSLAEIEMLEAQLMKHAVLWDEFRKEGLNMAPDKLDELIRLEQNSVGTGKGYELKLMIAELQEKNKHIPLKERKVGFVTQGAEQGKAASRKENVGQTKIESAVRQDMER